ncbi:CRISPR-associated protein Cas5 [Thermoflexus sp.]|uniref:CRISPR-associated protein Cas5 n=1 Tax=Thermoflexus sp. TaxID=1969742 RepID=UPI002ADD82F3|nr:CRISPR-associated protein Cas5 [Thermoflexus sp.]
MERILAVTVRAPVASFRRPIDHNYQRTLPLPPPTTLIGIAGAALGLSDRELWAPGGFARQLKVSAWMEAEPGRARDMWTVLKIKGGRIAGRSPYFRELLFYTRYVLIYGGPEEILTRLEQAFRDPAYPLSLGREDELAEVEEIALAEAELGPPRFYGTAVPLDVRQRPGIRLTLRPGAVFEPPVVERLPLAFEIDARGIRHPTDPIPISFLPLGVELEVPEIRAWRWKDRHFAWMNEVKIPPP